MCELNTVPVALHSQTRFAVLLCPHLPVLSAVLQTKPHRGNVRGQTGVTARLQQQHVPLLNLTEPAGEHRSGAAAADHNKIILGQKLRHVFGVLGRVAQQALRVQDAAHQGGEEHRGGAPAVGVWTWVLDAVSGRLHAVQKHKVIHKNKTIKVIYLIAVAIKIGN